MSNDKQCAKHCRLKFKVSRERLILSGNNKSVSKSCDESYAWWVKIISFFFKWQNRNVIFILFLKIYGIACI